MSAPLDAKEQVFVEHYRKSRNVPAAAAAAGLSPRAASKLLARPSIKAEIERPDVPDATASAPATPADDRSVLLRELDRVINGDGPDPAKVSAIALKAKLLGIGDPPPADPEDAPDVEPATPRDLARAVLGQVREYSAQLRDLLGVQLVIAYPGESIIRTRDPDIAKLHGGEPAVTLEEHLARGSSIAEREPVYSADGSEIRCNGYLITFGERSVQGRSRPIAEWTITNSSGVVVGRRLTSEEAVAFAKALPAN